MSTTEQRLTANRANALKSTGPTSADGKAAASRNATRHGLLSANMFLDDEAPVEFEALLIDLQAALIPVGCIELALVERVAVALWRMRRLVSAETAAITLTREDRKVASGVSSEMGLGYGSELKEADLQPFDQSQIEFCDAVLAEVETLEKIDPASLQKSAPTIFQQLRSDAEEDGEDVEAHLKARKDGLTGYIGELVAWCHTELRNAKKRPHIMTLARQVRARRLILPDQAIEVISRHQTTLDNQLYKALRALREAQEWRIKTLSSGADLQDNAA